MIIALPYSFLRELFKEVFDLRCLFFTGFSGFFPTWYFCHLTWCGWWNHFGVWRGLWERRNGVWDHPEMNLLLLEAKFTPAVSYLCQPLFFLPLGAICVSFQPNTDYSWEIIILKSDLTSQLWLWGAIPVFSPCLYDPLPWIYSVWPFCGQGMS